MPTLRLTPRGFIAGVIDRIARASAWRPPRAGGDPRSGVAGHQEKNFLPWYAIDTVSGATWLPRDTTAFAREGFMQNAVVYRCVRMIAEAAASVPLCLYDGPHEIEDHPLLDLLARPSPTTMRAEFLEKLIGFLLVSGNTYVEAIAAGDTIRELHVLRPDRITLVTGEDGWPEAYDYAVQGTTPVRLEGDIVLTPSRQSPSRPAGSAPVESGATIRKVLHQKLFHPLDDHYGLSPIEAAATAIDTHNAASRWNKALLDNSARPSGALVYTSRDGNLTADQYARLKQELEAGFQGAGNAGRPLLLEGGLDWKSMSMTPKDLDFMEAKHGAAREIALALGVPPMLLGIPGDNTFSNYQEANKTFWRQTVLPLAQRVTTALGDWLAPAWGEKLHLQIDPDGIPALSSEQDTLWTRLNAANFLTLDEKRAAAGYGPSPPAAKDFNPNQPRDDHGRWTSGPGGGGGGGNGGGGDGGDAGNGDTTTESETIDVVSDEAVINPGDLKPDAPKPDDGGDDAPVQDAADKKKSYNVDLAKEEQQGGHAIAEHVGKSDAYLQARVNAPSSNTDTASSFPSLAAANKLVNSTLSDNTDKVDSVASGKVGSDVVEARFGSATGYEAYKPSQNAQPVMRDDYGVRVVIRRDPASANGFNVVTAFPIK
jgi:phage portal protein BeeE